ncbi:tdp2 [Symbiodinium microadriaticum]|nr:tdp2 [Symbiodinium microadriaticum]CAE7734732.1 tdp2 [Symbiodinium sp. KB8]
MTWIYISTSSSHGQNLDDDKCPLTCTAGGSQEPRYEQAGADVKESLSGWAKQQEAALAEDQDEVDRLRKALEEARR